MNILTKTKDAVNKINEIKLQSKQEKMIIKLLNIILIIVVVAVILTSIDTVCVKKYNKGPYFAIQMKRYDDGGTKEYYGIGYKIIKYHQEQGRRDTVMGSWFLQYSTIPTTTTPVDLALSFRDDPDGTFSKLKGRFLKIEGTLDKVNLDQNKARIRFVDEDKSYSLDIICKMAEGEDVINNIVGTDVVVLGTVENYKVQTKDKVNQLIIKDAFIG